MIVSNDEVVEGTPGPDFICLGDGDNEVFAGAGDDVIRSQGGSETIHAGSGADRVYAGAGTDVVFGDGGADILRGGGGADKLNGGPGEDQIFGDAGNDRINGGHGNDVIHGGAGGDGIHARKGNDEVHGDDGNDRLQGGLGRDVLRGGAGNDIIRGNAGPDHLAGDAGRDFIDGRRGEDRCVAAFRYESCELDRLGPGSFEIDDWQRIQSAGRYYLPHKSGQSHFDPGTSLRISVFADETRSGLIAGPFDLTVDQNSEWSMQLANRLELGDVVLVQNLATGDETTRVVNMTLDEVSTGSGSTGGVSGRSEGNVTIGFRTYGWGLGFEDFEARPQAGEWSQSLENLGMRAQLVVVSQLDDSGNLIVAFEAPKAKPMFTATHTGVWGERGSWTPGGTATILIDDGHFDTVAIDESGAFRRPFVGDEDPLGSGRHVITVIDDATGIEKFVRSDREITEILLAPSGHVGWINGTGPRYSSFRIIGYDEQFREKYFQKINTSPEGTFSAQIDKRSAYYAVSWYDIDGDAALILFAAP